MNWTLRRHSKYSKNVFIPNFPQNDIKNTVPATLSKRHSTKLENEKNIYEQ